MNLKCKNVWEHISEYLDQQLTPEVRAEIEKHLENCEVCSAILDSTRNVLILTADNRTFELPVGYSKRLHDRLEKAIHQKPDPGKNSSN
ncbi:MAG TPA: anti-sigma factor [Candidatus Acidoferrum sp.]|nr:anti-sigma factor [Candidatus Acidoferrum sp.]